MGRAGLIMILLLLFAGVANAQPKIDFRRLDSSMYQAGISENWNEVIQVGKEALHHDIDYFYLRMRMGIAYFNKQHYRNSAEQMEKALEFSPEDPLVKEYLYYALIYSGQDDEAARASSSWRQSFKEEKGIEDRNGIDGIYLETGPEISNNFDENEMGRLPQQFRYREQDLYGNSYYSQLGVKLNIKPHITMYAAYANLIISRQASVQYKWWETEAVESYDYDVRQNSFYLNMKILLGKGWSFTPAINYIHVKTEDITIESFVPIGSQDARYDIRSLEYSFNNMVLSLAFNKQITVFDLGLFGSYSNLNNMSQLQLGFSATYYPFGNLNFYGNTTLKGLFEEDDLRPVFSQMLAVKASSFLWIEGFGTFGNLRSTNESNAFVVYNITDDINLKAGLNLIFVISPSVQLSLRYQYMQKEGERTEYSTDLPEGQRTVKLKYTNQSIIGGLKWTF